MECKLLIFRRSSDKGQLSPLTIGSLSCREIVFNSDNGFLVSVKSVDELEVAMTKIVEQSKLIDRMGIRSRQIAAAKYNVDR